jgi:hypothetical protein
VRIERCAAHRTLVKETIMNRPKLVLAAALAGCALAAPVAHAADTPKTPQKLAMEAARQGPAALRQFVNRTRMVYGLSFYDFYKPD